MNTPCCPCCLNNMKQKLKIEVLNNTTETYKIMKNNQKSNALVSEKY